MKHEEVLPHQKHDSHPKLANFPYASMKANDFFVKPSTSFSFYSVILFQSKFKTPIKKRNKTLHQQSLLLNDSDITSDRKYIF